MRRPGRKAPRSAVVEFVTLDPYEVAELLDLDRDHGPLLAMSETRLRAVRVARIRARTRPLRLSVAEVAAITGNSPHCVHGWCRGRLLPCRLGPQGEGYSILAADLVEFFHRRQLVITNPVAFFADPAAAEAG